MVPSTGNLISDTIEEQSEQAMKNLKAVVEAAGSSLNNVVKTTVYITVSIFISDNCICE